MKRVIIVDDEQDARELLKEYIANHSGFSVIGEATNGLEAIALINSLKPDTLFLDVQMPVIDGFEVLTNLEEIPEVIFSTAYDHYAIKAFEVHAVDYLLKPYGRKRFDESVSRILKNQNSLSALAEEILNKENQTPKIIILNKGNRKILVAVNDIYYAKSFGDYTKVFTKTESFLSVKGITHLNEALHSSHFIRIHRTHFINKMKLKEIKKVERYYYAILENGKSLKISDSYIQDIKKIQF